jgi:hypothetical protein
MHLKTLKELVDKAIRFLGSGVRNLYYYNTSDDDNLGLQYESDCTNLENEEYNIF